MTGVVPRSLCLSEDRFQAIYNHMFVANARFGLDRPLDEPLVDVEFLPDTDAHLPAHQRSGWAVTGAWGVQEFGSRWPGRFFASYRIDSVRP